MNNKNNITMTKFNLTKYYNNEEKLGPQGGGWAEPNITVQQFIDKFEKYLENK